MFFFLLCMHMWRWRLISQHVNCLWYVIKSLEEATQVGWKHRNRTNETRVKILRENVHLSKSTGNWRRNASKDSRDLLKGLEWNSCAVRTIIGKKKRRFPFALRCFWLCDSVLGALLPSMCGKVKAGGEHLPALHVQTWKVKAKSANLV